MKIIDGSGVFLLTLTIAKDLMRRPSRAATKFNLADEKRLPRAELNVLNATESGKTHLKLFPKTTLPQV